MAGQKFEYDESGATFFYFILSFLALILVPATFYFWPKKKTEGKNAKVTVNVSPLPASVDSLSILWLCES